MQRKLLLLILLTLPFTQVFTQNRQIDFIDPSINSHNEILTALSFPSLEGESYNALIRGQADTLAVEALTIYPEKTFYFSGRDELMVYNHFGCYSYKEGMWQEESYGKSFSSGAALSPLPLKPLIPSPNGKYTVYVTEDERGTASLVLYDRDRKQRTTVTSSLKPEYLQKMVKWSPDSKYFIYRRGRELYYFSIDQYQSGRIPAESFRKTGFNDIQSVKWSKGNYLYVLKGRYLYRVHSSEFFTRAFYSEPFRKGSVHGRLPVSYDPSFDKWAIDESGRTIVLLKNGETAIVHSLVLDTSADRVLQTPLLAAEYGTVFDQAEWLSDGSLLVRSRKIAGNEGRVYLYRTNEQFSLLAGSVTGISISKGRDRFALLGLNGAALYRAGEDASYTAYDQEEILGLQWAGDGYFLLGRNTLRSAGSDNITAPVIALSAVDRAGYTAGGDLIAETGTHQFRYNEALQWTPLKGSVETAPSRLGNSSYRIYLEKQSEGWYASSLKIRDVESFYTADLIPLYLSLGAVMMPRQMRPVSSGNPWYFDHGTNTDKKEIALVLNAVDSSEGTAELLDLLYRYRVPATFFLNGDFINSNPLETKIIAESGHTAGSLFYTMLDMADSGYQIDKDFLKKGLARNEDDYFIATGRELSMLWHTPGYYINSEILETSASMQYVFIGTDIPVQDRVSANIPYDAVSEAEKLLMRVKPGSILTLTIGGAQGQDEYLFQALPMIFDRLIRDGYSFVDLQDMMNASR